MIIKFLIEANIPDEHASAWLRHLAEFDHSHPGCNIAIAAESDHTTEEIEAIILESGEFPFLTKIMKQ